MFIRDKTVTIANAVPFQLLPGNGYELNSKKVLVGGSRQKTNCAVLLENGDIQLFRETDGKWTNDILGGVVPNQKQLSFFEGATKLCISNAGDQLAIGSNNGEVTLCKHRNGIHVTHLLKPDKRSFRGVCGMAFLGESRLVVAKIFELKLVVFSLDEGRQIGQMHVSRMMHAMATDESDRFLVAAGDGYLELFELKTMKSVGQVKAKDMYMSNIAVSRKSGLIACSSLDHTVQLWSIPQEVLQN